MTNLMLPGFGDEKPPDMATLRQMARACIKCRLQEGRTQVTWSSGDPHSPLMVVGMGPSVTDDQTGLPYTGPAGDELDEVLKLAGITRQHIYLTNAHKCVARAKDDPYNIRPPAKLELKACRQWLDWEFELVKPKVLLCIGAPTAQWLIHPDFDLSAQRGQWLTCQWGIPALATYQPTYITRLKEHDPAKAEITYQDMVIDFREAVKKASLA